MMHLQEERILSNHLVTREAILSQMRRRGAVTSDPAAAEADDDIVVTSSTSLCCPVSKAKMRVRSPTVPGCKENG